MVEVWGIPNCQTVKKARTWLDEHRVAYVFHDFKKEAPDAALLERWLEDVPLDTLLNRRGTTWRQLDEAARAAADSRDGALALMMAKPSVIKRPVVVLDRRIAVVGFDPERFAALA